MSKNDTWYGYLKAGDKSSPVVRDPSVETNSQKTVYLYNHLRGTFLEYSREIVEPKLRELTVEDIPLVELQNAFETAKKSFLAGRNSRKWEREAPARSAPASKDVDVDDGDDFPMDLDEDFEEYELEV